jgi:hypothetical protein
MEQWRSALVSVVTVSCPAACLLLHTVSATPVIIETLCRCPVPDIWTAFTAVCTAALQVCDEWV